MTGEGWVWIGSDGVATSLLQADGSVSKAAQGMIAVSPKSKLFFNGLIYSCQVASYTKCSLERNISIFIRL